MSRTVLAATLLLALLIAWPTAAELTDPTRPALLSAAPSDESKAAVGQEELSLESVMISPAASRCRTWKQITARAACWSAVPRSRPALLTGLDRLNRCSRVLRVAPLPAQPVTRKQRG